MENEQEECFTKCNEKYTPNINPKRVYCKKGCLSDLPLEECFTETCTKLCVKTKIGENEETAGEWTKFFSRAPADSSSCLDACLLGCQNKI